jgi:hypothetical protein
MTCREFEHCVDSLTLREMSQAQDQQILGHAAECQKCAAWLQQQRTLAATMQTLQARTADCAAGPNVEAAVLGAFRQAHRQFVQPEMEPGFTPIAMTLSRFFEIGAYVAVAAAIVVGLFLGVQLWQKRAADVPVEGKSVQPSVSLPSITTADLSGSNLQQRQPAESRRDVNRARARHTVSASQPDSSQVEASQNIDAGYVALMLCDPLSCSSDAQVVRMEIPTPGTSGGEQDAQMRFADVVVGYDGVVRAVRIVN